MSYLDIELARTIDEDRYREAEGHRRKRKTLATPQQQFTNPVQIVVNWLSNLLIVTPLSVVEEKGMIKSHQFNKRGRYNAEVGSSG